MNKTLSWISLAALAVIPFAATCHFGFAWDDHELVTGNPLIQQWTASNLFQIFSQSQGGLYSPLVFLSFAAERVFFGLNPAAYHIDNVVLHAFNALLVYLFARVLNADRAPAWWIAAFFAVHPVHAESVAWVTERKDVLYGLFYWAAAIFYIRFVKTGEKRFYVFSLVSAALSLLSKPMAVTLPGVLLAYELFYARLSWKSFQRLTPFFAAAAGFAAFTLLAFQQSSSIRPEFLSLGSLKIAAYSLLFYAGKSIFPIQYSALYPYPAPADPIYAAAPLWAALLLTACFTLARKHRDVLFGMVFFIVSLLPVIQLVPVGNTFAADRYLYTAVFGALFAAAFLLRKASEQKPRLKPFIFCVLGAALLSAAGASAVRAQEWRNDFTLWNGVLQNNPKSFIAFYNRGRAQHVQGNTKEALADYTKALELNPSHAGAQKNSCVIYGMMGELDRSLSCLDAYIQNNPRDAEAFYNRGVAFAVQGSTQRAAEEFRRALELNPHFKEAEDRLQRLSSG